MIDVSIGPNRPSPEYACTDGTVPPLDADELAAAVAGEPVALRAVVEWIRPVVVRYCRSRVDDPDPVARNAEVDDLVRTVTVDTLRTLPADTVDSDQLLAWAYRVAAATIGARARSAGPGAAGSTMAGLLPLLAPMQREVLTLRVIMGLSVEATVAVTGLTASAVRATQHRALAALRQRLASGTSSHQGC